MRDRTTIPGASGRARCWVAACAMVGALTAATSFAAGNGIFLRGDANSDARLDMADAVFTLNYVFQGGTAPTCLDAADINDDGRLDISDPISGLNYLFQGAAAPPAPYPVAGLDPTQDTLTCGPVSTGTGTLLLAIHDTPPGDLTEFWISIREIELAAADGTSVHVFPPESDPTAEVIVNLLDLTAVSSVVAAIAVPAGDYTALHLEFDNASAKAGADDVLVVPDSGESDVAFAAPITVTDGTLTSLFVDFNLTASLSDGGPGRVLLDAQLSEDEDEGEDGEHEGHHLGDFHGVVVSVDPDAGTMVVDITARQRHGMDPVVVGQVTVTVDDATSYDGVDGLGSIEVGQRVEVEGKLQEDGSVLAGQIELKGAGDGEDLDDDGINDDDEDPDHDSDIDNDGQPNVDDSDDDDDGIDDTEDNDHDNDGIDDDVDNDDDNDGIDDDVDNDDDGDGVHDDEDDDHEGHHGGDGTDGGDDGTGDDGTGDEGDGTTGEDPPPPPADPQP